MKPKTSLWAAFWEPFRVQNRCLGGSGTFGDHFGHHLGSPGPPGSKKERKSDSATFPLGPSWDSKSLLSVTFGSSVKFVTVFWGPGLKLVLGSIFEGPKPKK